jgi:hypothetical protein
MRPEPTYSPPIIELGTVSEPTLGRIRKMSASDTFETCSDVRIAVANEGKPDMAREESIR